MYQFTDGGLRNVWLENGYAEKDTPYGQATSFHDLEGLTHVICSTLAHKPGKLSGVEFRYLRSGLPLSQNALGKLLGCTEQAVAKWEKQGRVPKAEDCLIRLIYMQKHDSDRQPNSVVELLDAIDCAGELKIIVAQIQGRWMAKIEHADISPEPAEAA
jgi:DNA-binding transcriptional regulator YiaG